MKPSMKQTRLFAAAAALALAAVLLPAAAQAQSCPVSSTGTGAGTTVTEDFTQTCLNNTWTPINGACLTAGTSTMAGGGAGSIPSCTGAASSSSAAAYYINNGDSNQIGGANGYLGNTTNPGSIASQSPDPMGSGALRLTNGAPYYHESGAIVSTTPFPANAGVQITFKTITYHGDSGGSGGDGADGISFFLLDASQYTAGSGRLGSWGGSLAYTCSNQNPPYTGQTGAYMGLGIDEYGNFLNGGANGSGFNDNTASGVPAVGGWGSGNYQWNRIGLRGAGNVNWTWLNANYPLYYPASLTTGQQETAVRSTCETGTIWNYSTPTSPVNTNLTSVGGAAALMDYAPIPNASVAIKPSTFQIAAEGAAKRAAGTPVYYVLNITSTGLLSLSYSVGGGTSTSVLTNQSVSASNGSLPANLLFGFAGSTGGSDNIHEILCFQATPADQSDASTTVDLPQDQLITTAQVYLPSYHTNDWWGELQAQTLSYSPTNPNVLTVNTTPVWDAACELTQTIVVNSPCPNVTNVSFEAATSRVMLTWNPTSTVGVPLEWTSATLSSAPSPTASTINAAEINALDNGDASQQGYRLDYLRGDQSYECPSTGCTSADPFRVRNAVLGDIVHSSPVWVGPPGEIGYESTFSDNINSAVAVAAENTATQTYSQFYGAYYGRENVVYVGANDGLLHGFRAGSYVNNALSTSYYNNDGWEVLSYMPAGVLSGIHSTDPAADYASPNYSHIFGVDAAPAADDIFYNGGWHTWIVGGLGAGGAEIYALDVTDPSGAVTSGSKFSEADAPNLVMGDWTGSTLTCAGATPSSLAATCGAQLNNTYGTPVMWRFHALNAGKHNMWGAVFGNGLPDRITASISSSFSASIGNSIVGVIGELLAGTINNKTVVQTDGNLVLAVGATIGGNNVPSGTTVTAVSSGCSVITLPCTYTISKSATGNAASATQPWSMSVAGNKLYVSSGTLSTCTSSCGSAFPIALTDDSGVLTSGTTITGYITSNAEYAIYTINNSQLVATESMYTPSTTMTVTVGAGLAVGQTVTAATGAPTALASGTTITAAPANGGPGIYTVSKSQVVSPEQMTVGVWTLNVSAGQGIALNQVVTGAGVATGTKINGLGTGTGGEGIYVLNSPSGAAAVSTETMYANPANDGGTAGIYVMLVDPSSTSNPPTISFYYLDTGYGPSKDPFGNNSSNGIAFVTPVDFDGDNTVDYVYAGDAFGNLWRFDLTSSNPANWKASTYGKSSATPLFTTYSATGEQQPITTKPVVIVAPQPNGVNAVMVDFGTGQEIPFNPVSPTTYAPGYQSLYGIWDWDMGNWNSLASMSLASETGTITGTTALSSLATQTVTINGTNSAGINEEWVTGNPVCWYGQTGITGCTGTGSQLGWKMNLTATANSNEQVIYNPSVWQGELQVNTTLPVPSTSLYSCTVPLPSGYTMFINPLTGGTLTTSAWINTNGSAMTTTNTSGATVAVTGLQLGATGTGTTITTQAGQSFFIAAGNAGSLTNSNGTTGSGGSQVQGQQSFTGHRVTWSQLR